MNKVILIIDDEELVLRSLQRLLKKQGYDVVTSLSFKEAMEKLKQQDFDLIISDVRMPGIDGIEGIAGIREYLKKQGRPPIPEILITGYADVETYKRATQLNVADYIYKPFDTQDLLDVVRKNIK